MRIPEKELENFIVESGLVSRDDIEEQIKSAKEKGESLADTLVSSNVLSRDDIRRAEAHVLGVPFVELKDLKFELSTLALIPEPVSRIHNIIAYNKKGDSVEVAMLDTDDLKHIDFLKKAGLKLNLRLTSDDSMKSALLAYQKILKAGFGDTIAKDGGKDALHTLLKHAILQGASDIHIEPEEKDVRVRYRIGGILRDAMVLPKNILSGMVEKLKSVAKLKPVKKDLPQEGMFTVSADGEGTNYRLMILPTHQGEKLFIRVVGRDNKGFTLEGLGLTGEHGEEVHKALDERAGLILVVGPEKSGKTTTLYTLMDILNRPEINISTIEDPVEYYMHRINQTQIRPEIGFGFADGFRAVLRQEPDVIMVGDLNDAETAILALNTAHSGRLVLAAMDAYSPVEAINLLKNMNISPSLIASGLRLALSQKLVKGSTGSNRGEYEMLKMSPYLRKFILDGVI